MPEKQTQQEVEEVTEVSSVVRIFRGAVVLILAAAIGFFVYASTVDSDSRFPFKLGLDLAGGSHLVYRADVSSIPEQEVPDAMSVLREVIERRTNVFGVSEPIVQVEQSSFVSGEREQRLVVELPGVTDVEEAIREIGKTPLLEFKLVNPSAALEGLQLQTADGQAVTTTSSGSTERYIDTGLTGRYLSRASLQFGQGTGSLSNEPIVVVEFTSEGSELFGEITSEHVGEQLAIFLDGQSVSEPVIQQSITGGTATISGNFTPDEARELVRNLNFGALPVPIELVSTQSIGASLGQEVLDKGVRAGIIGLGLVMLFMIAWYRVPGVVASVALLVYIAAMLALFKLVPVTLTAAGLAAFILSVGMAVDANVLVFARMQEEFARGKDSVASAREGFARAWSAIRDSNVTSFLSAIILFWFGTSIVKGFALVFGIGVLLSMLSAITVTRTLLMALPVVAKKDGGVKAWLFGSGISDKS